MPDCVSTAGAATSGKIHPHHSAQSHSAFFLLFTSLGVVASHQNPFDERYQRLNIIQNIIKDHIVFSSSGLSDPHCALSHSQVIIFSQAAVHSLCLPPTIPGWSTLGLQAALGTSGGESTGETRADSRCVHRSPSAGGKSSDRRFTRALRAEGVADELYSSKVR